MMTEPPELYVGDDDEPAVCFVRVEGRLFEALMRHRWCSHSMLRGLLPSGVGNKAVFTHIQNLRGKLADALDNRIAIKSLRCEGYKLEIMEGN